MANPTAANATNASTASCNNAAGSVSEGMAFMAANDTTSNTANAAATFPLRTLRTPSAHTPLPRSYRSSRFIHGFPRKPASTRHTAEPLPYLMAKRPAPFGTGLKLALIPEPSQL